MQRIRYVNPETLKPHPINATIYGAEEPDPEFIERVRTAGCIKETIILLPGTNTIVSGHRRQIAAIAAGIETVPVLEDDDLFNATEAEVALAIVNYNDQREKTVEQRAREFKVRAGLHAELAKERAGGRPKTPKNTEEKPPKIFTEVSGEAKNLAAKEVGMSRPTAEKAAEVVDAIDEAKAAGDEGRVAELREKLNESVSAAHRQVAAPKPKTPKEAAREYLTAAERSLGALQGGLYNAKRLMQEAKLKPIDVEAIDSHVKEIHDAVTQAKAKCK